MATKGHRNMCEVWDDYRVINSYIFIFTFWFFLIVILQFMVMKYLRFVLFLRT